MRLKIHLENNIHIFLRLKMIKTFINIIAQKNFMFLHFIEMNCNYFFRLLKPGEKISVIIDQYQIDEKILYASQDGQRVDFNTKELIKSYLKHPLMTFKIISAIHFEAFKLWIKGIKFIKKKLKLKIILLLKVNEFI